MTRLIVDLGHRSYPIILTPELPGDALCDVVLAEGFLGRCLVVSDTHVAPLYLGDVQAALERAGLRVDSIVLPAGETSKTLSQAEKVMNHALNQGLKRNDLLVALGGGVVGDITGFAAAVLHRGMSFIQVPTTLLAQVDSAVGGKTGVNHPSGKNLIGAFWQPLAVISSQRVLETLDARERRCGLSEAVKHGLIASAELVDWILENRDALKRLETEPTAKLVAWCCEIKAGIVAEDERDRGRRAHLNFGHTLGHAYERLMGYGALTHGEAVALGMMWATRLSVALGVAEPGLLAEVKEVLSSLGLPQDVGSSNLPGLERLLLAAKSDKKALSDSMVCFVLLEKVGRTLIRDLDWGHIKQSLITGSIKT